jgi:hypothetical protein
LLATIPVCGKKKDKQTLPDVVLRAETVFVTILPNANEPLTEPDSNQKAVREVEQALMKWGRFRLALTPDTADLVVAVMKGTGKAVTPTVGGGPVDSRPVILDRSGDRTGDQIRIGGQSGRPDPTQPPDAQDDRVHVGQQLGGAEDVFKVYQSGGVQNALLAAPVWSYSRKDALRPPEVLAVAEFRKAFEESEKAAAEKQQKQQQKKSP